MLFGLFLVGVGYFQYTEIFSVVPPDTTLGILRVAYVVVSITFPLGQYEGLKRIPIVGDLCGFRNKIANKAGAYAMPFWIKSANSAYSIHNFVDFLLEARKGLLYII